MKQLNIFADGGSRGNPGPAAIGIYITDGHKNVLAKRAKKIGKATNNQAEYMGLLMGLDWLIDNQKKFEKEIKINFFLDSQLVYSQVVGIFKVKNEKIRKFIFELRQKEAKIQHPVRYNLIPREKNREADKLVNLALDNLF
ncbi:MAG: hypothetical protein A2W22_00740 [Candidatus Levybacteria bacterium RBG_16_35_11]|nr:MAG: hypothetical protein A2W22_00740 [Candidatus Levybacteria bacterium RBG_16_35_11]